MVGASLGALAAGGHLVEIGKRDIWAHASVKAERGDALYSVLAIDLLPAACNKRLLHQLAACLSQGLGASDVGVVYGLESAAGAMRKMAGGKHVGKVVLVSGAGGLWELRGHPGIPEGL